MPAVLARRRAEEPRQRRAHGKSRKGCGNCKLRRVKIKCDELQPSCQKCKLYGVSCDYSDLESLNLESQGCFQVHLSPGSCENDRIDRSNRKSDVDTWIPLHETLSIHSSLATIVNDTLQADTQNVGMVDSPWRFSAHHLEIISKFKNRTSITIGGPNFVPVYRDLVCQLACKHAFLMHMLLSVTLMHDEYLASSVAGITKYNQGALAHWNTASTMFNKILSSPIPQYLRDAIWTTGVMLGAASFWSIGSTDPHAVWPLKPAEPDDLAWLRVGEGKKHLWRIAQPRRHDSIFYHLVKDHNCITVPEWSAIDLDLPIADRIMHIFDIRSSPHERNIYYRPILTLSKCPNVKITQENFLKFMYVMAVITPEFLEILESKDVRAVFILGWWYILLTTGDMWWMSRRARVEGQAIRIWLRKQQGGGELADLLDEIEWHSGTQESTGPWFFEAV